MNVKSEGVLTQFKGTTHLDNTEERMQVIVLCSVPFDVYDDHSIQSVIFEIYTVQKARTFSSQICHCLYLRSRAHLVMFLHV